MKVRFYSELIYELCSTEDQDKTGAGGGAAGLLIDWIIFRSLSRRQEEEHGNTEGDKKINAWPRSPPSIMSELSTEAAAELSSISGLVIASYP